MALIYRSSGAWGAGKGAPLVSEEADGNFYELDQRVAAIEGEHIGIGIDYFEVSTDGLMTVRMSDSTTRGPYVLPVASWNDRGAWAADTSYLRNDIVSEGSALYRIQENHTSPHVFDPGYNLGAGHDVYQLLVAPPEAVIPVGGTANQYLRKVDSSDFHTQWANADAQLPTGGHVGQALRKKTEHDFDYSWQDDAALPDVIRTLDCQINETDLLASTAQYLVAPCAGAIEGLDAVVQKAVTTGGTIEISVGGSPVAASTVTIGNGIGVGVIESAEISGGHAVTKGQIISLVISGFATAGAVNCHVRYR